MKTSILTSFVTIALVAATSSFAFVVRSQIQAPELSLPLPSAPVQSGVPIGILPQQRRFFPFPSQGGKKDLEDAKSDGSPTKTRRAHDQESDVTDAKILNVALALELLERAFYERGLSQYSEEDFKKAGYPDWVRGRFEQIYEHEKTHVQFLESALTAAGNDYVKPCDYVFNDKSPRELIDMSEALEIIGTSAYTGSIQYISDDGYTTAAASILATEARHASWINSAVRKENPWNTAFETPLTLNQVFTFASNFIKPDSCPKSNDLLLPSDLHAYPQLTLASKLIPGQEVQLSFSPEKEIQGEHLYVAFLSGAATIFAPLNKKEDTYVVEIPGDLKAAGTVFVIVFKGGENIGEARLDDESTVAGPATAVFPFDSRGKYPSERRKRNSE